jgi:hypothetical protein
MTPDEWLRKMASDGQPVTVLSTHGEATIVLQKGVVFGFDTPCPNFVPELLRLTIVSDSRGRPACPAPTWVMLYVTTAGDEKTAARNAA